MHWQMDKAVLTSMNGGRDMYGSSLQYSEAGIEDICSMYSSSAPIISSANRYRKDELSTIYSSDDHLVSSKDGDLELMMAEVYLRQQQAKTRATKLQDIDIIDEEHRLVELLETENDGLKSELVAMKAENMALSKALKERALSLAAIRSCKEEAESAAIALQVHNESLRKDVDAQKFEIRLLKKKNRVKDEEKERIAKEADAANQRISKLESDCHRLRMLIHRHRSNSNYNIHHHRNRRKDESESMEPIHNPWSSSRRNSSSNNVSDPNCHECHQLRTQKHALAERLASTEEENQLLKETLVDRTTELQSATQIRSEAMLMAVPALITHGALRTSDADEFSIVTMDDCLQSSAVTNLSDVNNSAHDDNGEGSSPLSAESWALALMSELSHIRDHQDHAKHNRNGVLLKSLITAEQQIHAAASCKYSALSHDPRFGVRIGSILEEISEKISSIEDSIYAWLSDHETRLIQHGKCCCAADDDDNIDDSGADPCNPTATFYRQMERQFSLTKQMLTQLITALTFCKVNNIDETNVTTTRIMKRMLRKLVDAFLPLNISPSCSHGTDDLTDVDGNAEQKRYYARTAGEGTDDPIDLSQKNKACTEEEAEAEDDDPIDVDSKNRFMLQKDDAVSAMQVLADYMKNRVKEVTWDEEATELLCELVDAVAKLKPIDLQLRIRRHTSDPYRG